MTKKLILLMAASLAVLGYTFAETTAGDTETATATDTAATATTSDSGAENVQEDDLDLNSILDDTGDESASTGTETTTASSDTSALTWGYKDVDIISSAAEDGAVVLKSSVLKDAAGKDIMTYVVKYSTKSMSEKIDSLEGASAPQEKSFVFVASGDELVASDGSTGSTSELSLKIDGLSAGTYYFIVTPKNADNVEGTPSKEVSVVVNGVASDDAGHGAATAASNGADLTISGSTATVSWQSMSGATQVQVFLKFAGDADYKKEADVEVSKGKFTFKVQAKKDFLVKLVAVDAAGAQVGPDQILTGKGSEVAINAPKVGPASTALFGILLLSIVAYVTYRFRKVRS